MRSRFLIPSLRQAAAAMAVSILFLQPVLAKDIAIQGKAGEASPFEFEDLKAQLTEDDNGKPVLKLQYAIHNRSEETISAVAWGLEVQDASGEVVSGLGGAFAVDIPAGLTVARSQTIGGATAARVKVSGSLTVTAAGGSFSAYGICAGSAQTEEDACQQWDFACEALCGAHNPLTGGPGVQASPCGSCTWLHDSQNDCDYLSCQAMCVCNESIWPPYMPVGEGPWAEDISVLPPGSCGEPIHPEEGFFFFRN